jgi:circadian clock protein KaiC
MLSESHASMLKNLRKMSFFDRSVLNTNLHYVGAYKALREQGLRALFDVVRQVIMDRQASLLILDGVAPARIHAPNDVALKEFIVELQTLCSLTGCTSILLANMTNEDANGPEHTMVDGLIELAFDRTPKRTSRTLEVVKFRANEHLLGRQDVAITKDGLVVYPRLEDQVTAHEDDPVALDARVGSGIPHLDEMLGGGFLAGTTSILLGFTGSGKTTLGLHFLDAAVARKESALYFGFYESRARVLAASDKLGLGLREAAKSELFEIVWHAPYELGLDALGKQLLDEVKRKRVRRLVIDGLDGFRQAATDPERTIRFMTALTNALRGLGVTTLVTEETPRPYGPEVATRVEGTSALVDAIVLLEYLTHGTELRRLLSVIKQRETRHNLAVREFVLTDTGVRMSADAATAEEILNRPDEPLSVRSRKPKLPHV